ncbi:polyprenyl synthetase family protein [Corynebacterium breve]|uniref:Polyprenyl synthetase family protein n=1 Tax=Corynebacterium breve TaxID=3049799 RepID=A0ABY8VEG2_9CORY|nr:polyprenyl synthetase family protein [Corynebacterium breve]WIM68051.1 polyprenyl synthetase family protein [Corynebacterium breve]
MTPGTTPSPRSVPRVELGDEALTERIHTGMREVEELLVRELSKGPDFVSEKVLHLAQAGGKRFRPLMALLASEYGPRQGSENVVKAAAIVEMVHLATLYHDDVMDEADKRRGVESANARWGNSVAILAGDILLSHTSRLMSELDTDTVAHFAETFGELVTGQMRETIGAGDSDPIEHYMQVIKEKTGVLIASAGYLGARHSGASDEIVSAMYRLGGDIGIVFQIIDDMIDIFSDAKESGKTPGTDLREGVFTLPVLYALEEDTAVGEELRGMLTGPLTDDAEVARALELLARSTGRERSMEVVYKYLAEADKEIALLPESAATTALGTLARYTVDRVG